MNVFFGHTMTQSSAYYRMVGFAEKMKELKLVKYFTGNYDPEKLNAVVNEFENRLANQDERKGLCEEIAFLNLKKKIKMWIFQPFSSEWGIALVDLIHKIYVEPVLMEIDDYAFGVDSSNPNARNYDPTADACTNIKHQLEMSDAVIVSTEELKKMYLPFNKNIHVIPNAIDFSIFDKLKNNKHKSFINIGWQGGSSHKKDLKIVEPVIKAILKKYKNVRFTILGGDEGMPESLKRNKRIKWVNDWIPVNKYPAYKASFGFDIELAPLADTQFNRCKSNLRYLEASALKIPVVASNVGPYKNICAATCETKKDWIRELSLLIEDKTYRETLGEEAYKDVKTNYNMIDTAKHYAIVIKKERGLHMKRVKKIGLKAFEEGDQHVYTV